MKTFFPRKKIFLHHIFYFSNVQSSVFFQINLKMTAENTFLRNIAILYAFTANLLPLAIFKKNSTFAFRKIYLF